MKILIVYGTTEGQTRKIARFIGDVLQEAGHTVSLADASDDPPSPADFDAILIGASIHIRGYQASVKAYIKRHLGLLNQLPGAFFSVCLAIASDFEEEHDEANGIAREFPAHLGWEPLMIESIAGALKYTEYDFFKRWVMKMIARKEGQSTDTTRDHEYTDWEGVKAFATAFAEKAGKIIHG